MSELIYAHDDRVSGRRRAGPRRRSNRASNQRKRGTVTAPCSECGERFAVTRLDGVIWRHYVGPGQVCPGSGRFPR